MAFASVGSLAAPRGFLQAGCGVGPNLQTPGKPSPGALLSELKATQVPTEVASVWLPEWVQELGVGSRLCF